MCRGGTNHHAVDLGLTTVALRTDNLSTDQAHCRHAAIFSLTPRTPVSFTCHPPWSQLFHTFIDRVKIVRNRDLSGEIKIAKKSTSKLTASQSEMGTARKHTDTQSNWAPNTRTDRWKSQNHNAVVAHRMGSEDIIIHCTRPTYLPQGPTQWLK